MEVNMNWLCPVEGCVGENFSSKSELLKHIRSLHACCLHYKCKIESCDFESSTYHSFRMHLLRAHVRSCNVNSTLGSHTGITVPVLFDDDHPVPVLVQGIDDRFHGEPESTGIHATTTGTGNKPNEVGRESSENDVKDRVYDSFLLFGLRCLEQYTLPKSVFRDIMFHVVELMEEHQRSSQCPDLQLMMRQTQSNWMFRKALLKIGLVEPVTQNPTQDDTLHYQYIPILSTLQSYLSRQDVLESVLNNLSASDNGSGDLFDYCDGTNFQNNCFFKGDRTLLRICLYVDEIEVCNPIGSSRVKHKLTCFYFTLGNVEKQYLSSLKNIHPVIIAKSSVVKGLGYFALLAPLRRDLIILENEGVDVTMHNGTVKHLKGSLATIVADNLGMHDICGFRRTFSCGPICRFCLCHYDDLTTKCSETMFKMRNGDSHVLHVRAVASHPDLEKVYGVRRGNPFEGLQSFNVIDNSPPDIMHDVLSCIIPLTLDFIIKDIVFNEMSKQDFITLVQEFPWGRYEIRNRPKYNGSLSSLTASENWCFFRHFSYMAGSLVSVGNPTWEIYLDLSRICDIVFAKSVSSSMVSDLRTLVVKFYRSVLRMAPHIIKPKFHFLLHYPTMIERYGPLTCHWTMRFESYHQIVKKICRASGNFKNIALTVASRLQQRKCWEFQPTNSLCAEDMLPCDVKCVSSQEIPEKYTDLISVEALEQIGSAKVLLNSYKKFQVNDIYPVWENADGPVFCQVKYILYYNKQWHICGELLASSFSAHFHSYNVKRIGICRIFNLEEIKWHRPCDLYSVDRNNYIRPYHS